MACWKARVRLPIRCNWTFFASSYYWGATRQNVSKVTAFRRGWVSLSQDFRGMGRPSGIFFWFVENDTFCYLTVQTAPCYVQSFWHNTGVWQTDRQWTDGIAVASTVLAMRAVQHAVKSRTLNERCKVFLVVGRAWFKEDWYVEKAVCGMLSLHT